MLYHFVLGSTIVLGRAGLTSWQRSKLQRKTALHIRALSGSNPGRNLDTVTIAHWAQFNGSLWGTVNLRWEQHNISRYHTNFPPCNVIAYRSLFVLNYLAKNSVTMLTNLPYSLYLRLADFLLFLWLKIFVYGRKFSKYWGCQRKCDRTIKRINLIIKLMWTLRLGCCCGRRVFWRKYV